MCQSVFRHAEALGGYHEGHTISKDIFVFFRKPLSLMCEQGTAPLTSNPLRTLNTLRG